LVQPCPLRCGRANADAPDNGQGLRTSLPRSHQAATGCPLYARVSGHRMRRGPTFHIMNPQPSKQPRLRQESLPDRGRLRLWPISAALGLSFLAAALGLAGLALLALALLPGNASLHDEIGALQLVFAAVAGAGALVALVVAYRRQKVAEADSAHDRTRVFNERFTTIAAQLGDAQPAVRLAGVHAMAGLADDWEENRQTCIDVLCAYLRMPYKADPGDQADAEERLAYRAIREVRHTVIRVITAHLKDGEAVSWQGLNFDFTGVVFDGGDFGGAEFSGGEVFFGGAEFSGGEVFFGGAEFSGGEVFFGGAEFSGGEVGFSDAEFSGGRVGFSGAKFSGGEVGFGSAKFSGGEVGFSDAEFSGSTVGFSFAKFSGSTVDFSFAKFSGGEVGFGSANFSGGEIGFSFAKFSGGEVGFSDAEFSGGMVDFSHASDWSSPPAFPWTDAPSSGVKLPKKED
jgi:uncharacterized protein YjbI with pentapeptide repeats